MLLNGLCKLKLKELFNNNVQNMLQNYSFNNNEERSKILVKIAYLYKDLKMMRKFSNYLRLAANLIQFSNK